MTENRWAELRQVGFATLDHQAAVRTATELLALGPGFDDPLLAAMHLADFTAPVGPDTYVEVLAPTTPDHSVARWLGRVGGASGWVLSTQVPSLDGVKERATEHGVRIAVETQAMGHDIVQLHRSTSACCSSSTRSCRATSGSGTTFRRRRRRTPAGAPRLTTSRPSTSRSTRRPEAPAAMAATWAAIIGLEPPVATADGAAIAFSSRTIRFVPARSGRTGIVAVDVHAADREHGVGLAGELCHTLIRFV